MPGEVQLLSRRFIDNIHIVDCDPAKRVTFLKEIDIYSGHFTNGVYSYPERLIVPTVLAGFQRMIDIEQASGTPLIIAVNSDASLKALGKSVAVEGDQHTRALKVAKPLACQHPKREIVVLFFNEPTPNPLFEDLENGGFGRVKLFKWGYGTDPNGGIIEGASYFKHSYGFPLPNDIKPVCYDLTRTTGQDGNVTVTDLRTEIGPHGKPYISRQNECLFPLNEKLLEYGPRNNLVRTAEKPQPKL